MRKEQKYKTAINIFNAELLENEAIKEASIFYNKSIFEIVSQLQCRLYTSFSKAKNTFKVWLNFTDINSGINIKHEMQINFKNKN